MALEAAEALREVLVLAHKLYEQYSARKDELTIFATCALAAP